MTISPPQPMPTAAAAVSRRQHAGEPQTAAQKNAAPQIAVQKIGAQETGAAKTSAEKNPAPETGTAKTSGKKKQKSVLAPLLFLAIGLAILLYPVIASQMNNYGQQVVVDKYRSLLQDVPQAELDKALAAARTYNQTLNSTPALEPWPARVSDDNLAYKEYEKYLTVFPMMGVLEVPSIGVNLPIYHGTTDETLDKGIGHLFGTHLPVGGIGTHAVLTGHTGLPYATMLDRLIDVKKGDRFSVFVAGERLMYEVREIQVVLPEDVHTLYPVAGKDLLTLVTCTPYGINSHRLVVTGERIPLPPDEQTAAPEGPAIIWQTWMLAVLGAAVLCIIYAVIRVTRNRRRQKQKGTEADNAGQ